MLVNRCSEIRAAKIVKSGNVYLNNFSLDIEQALQCKGSVLEKQNKGNGRSSHPDVFIVK